MSKEFLDPETALNIADADVNADVDVDADVNADVDADVYADVDVLEPEDNMMSSQFKLMSFLNAAMLNQQPHRHMYSEDNEEEFKDNNLKELIENISDTNNLIYDETCSITINNEQIKDDISDLKNKFDEFQIEIENLKLNIEEILTNLRNKINI